MATLSKVLSALLLLSLIGFGAVRAGLVTESMSPFSPLSLGDRDQWFVDFKIAALRDDPDLCRAALKPPHVDASPVSDRPPADGCGWTNSVAFTEIAGAKLTVRPLTCEATAALALWLVHEVLPAAQQAFGSRVARIQSFGTYSCRNIEGSSRRSQHASANAIDIAGFTLEDGRSISVRSDWRGKGPKADFLRKVHGEACRYFRVALGPDYNANHADHFHLDRSRFWACL